MQCDCFGGYCALFSFLVGSMLYYNPVLHRKELLIMFTNHVAESYFSCRKFRRLTLAFFSVFGSSVGVITAYHADPYTLHLMRMAVSMPVSIVGHSGVILFPFLITAVVAYIEKPYLLFPLSFLKSLLYSLSLTATCINYSFAGWLVSGLLLFTDSAAFFLLHWYWARYINGFHKTAISDLLCIFLLALMIGIADLLLVSPYLTALMTS